MIVRNIYNRTVATQLFPQVSTTCQSEMKRGVSSLVRGQAVTTQNDLVPLFQYSGFIAETRFRSDRSSI